MNIVPEKTTLVIAGAFNPAILSPNWILTNVLGRSADDNLPVEILAPINGAGPTKISFEGFSFTPSTQKLIVHLEGLDHPAADDRVVQTARIVELLPHTPIVGVGFNFSFRTDAPSETAAASFRTRADLLETLGHDAHVVQSSWGAKIQSGSDLVSAIARISAADLELDLNFHVATGSVEDVITLLRADNAFSSRHQQAQNFAASFNS